MSACSICKQSMKAMGRFLHKVEATDEDDEEYVRGLMMKYGRSEMFFFCNLKGTSNQTAISFGMQ